MNPDPSLYGITEKDVQDYYKNKSLFEKKFGKLFGPSFFSESNLLAIGKIFLIFGGISVFLVSMVGLLESNGSFLLAFFVVPLALLFFLAVKEKVDQNSLVVPSDLEERILATEKYLKAKAAKDAENYQIQKEEQKRLENLQRQYEAFWFNLSGVEFENKLKDVLEKNRFTKVSTTAYSGDNGIDLFAVDPDGKKVVFQCKAHSRPVSPDDVRAFFGSFKAVGDKADYGVLVALSGVTDSGSKFMRDNGLKLWTVKDVVKLARQP